MKWHHPQTTWWWVIYFFSLASSYYTHSLTRLLAQCSPSFWLTHGPKPLISKTSEAKRHGNDRQRGIIVNWKTFFLLLLFFYFFTPCFLKNFIFLFLSYRLFSVVVIVVVVVPLYLEKFFFFCILPFNPARTVMGKITFLFCI